VFDHDSTQVNIYNSLIKNQINSLLKGYNATIFAYGQTGSGKTFTILGEEDEKVGLAPRAICDLFQTLDSMNSDYDILISCLQIYQERLKDLLAGKENDADLLIRENKEGETYAEGLIEVNVSSPDEILKLLKKAQKNRITASTSMNEVSSRSHFIMILTLLQYTMSNVRKSKLVLVDLAGSERVSESKAQGKQLVEACFINKSLFALSGVVEALASKAMGKSKEDVFVPFRNSKLTFLLKDSLGGNCKTTLIATISPAMPYASESLSTLQFAFSCKQIENVVKVNEYLMSIPRNFKPKKKKKEKVLVPWDSLEVNPKYQHIQTSMGKIALLVGGDPKSPAAIYLHGCPSSSGEF